MSDIKKREERETGPDIIRVLAAFLVVGIHFFLNSGFYQLPAAGGGMFLLILLRSFCMICVPLFMMLTGYLKAGNTSIRKNYLGLVPVLAAYAVISVLQIVVLNRLYGWEIGFLEGGRRILRFQTGWYVGMYIGLVLLAPFLNRLFQVIEKRERGILIIGLLCLTAVPALLPYGFPEYWQGLYPITYYLLGSCIREYRPAPGRGRIFLLLAGVLAVTALASYQKSRGGVFHPGFLQGPDNGYGSLPLTALAVLVFLSLYRIRIRTAGIQRLLCLLSGASLPVYLFSAITDAFVYRFIQPRITGAGSCLLFFLPAVLCSFLAACILALTYQKIKGVLR